MKIAQPARNAFGPELICLLATAVFALGAALWLWLSLPWPRCNFHALFGIPCLTCGSTRAALALLHGDIFAAWKFNPLATTTLVGLALYNGYALAVLCSERLRVRIPAAMRARWRLGVVLLAAASLLNWLYLLR
ncbi:MAG TPA: DUF2752 domain-containing protein, partial [Chthoniobacterales bacterium]|nr:DUF2752 domain-containing protein [Chthoniobacterales bacterium]